MTNITDKFGLDYEWDNFAETGNMHSLEVIYNYFFDFLFNYGKRYNIGEQLIEDAIQNIFIGLMNAQKQKHQINNLAAYITHSFRNELFYLNKKNRIIPLQDNIPKFNFDNEDNLDSEIIRNEANITRRNALMKCIKKLPPSQQEMIYLRYYIGLSYEEIATIFCIKVQSCRTTVYRAIKCLKKDISTLRQKGVL